MSRPHGVERDVPLTLALLALAGLVAGLLALASGDAVLGVLVGLVCAAGWLDGARSP